MICTDLKRNFTCPIKDSGKTDVIPIGTWYSKRRANTFKKYEAIMAQKRQRKAEKTNQTKAKKDFWLSVKVKGSSQRYARMGPLIKRSEVLEDGLYMQGSVH